MRRPPEKKPARRPPARRKRHVVPGILAVVVVAAALFLLRWRVLPTMKPQPSPTPTPQESAAGMAQEPGWSLLLVSAQAPLDRAFTVDLEKVSGWRVDTRIAGELRELLAAAQADGVELSICSAYRGTSKQTQLYNDQISKYVSQGLGEAEAEARAGRLVQPPGCSEHHTGLALDITAPYHQSMDEDFARTAAFQWLRDHGPEYGFTLRYPKEKSGITGIDFEPWHFRYVGREAARAMADADLCLEEYLELLPGGAAPTPAPTPDGGAGT